MDYINKKKLGIIGLFALSISGVAPTGAMAFSTSTASSVAGINFPLSFMLGGIGILMVGLCFASMAKYVDDAGSAYAYNRMSFGENGGFLTGWILTLSYLVLFISQIGITANFFNVFIQNFGYKLPNVMLSIFIIASIWIISVFGLKKASAIAFIIEFIAILILFLLSAIILIKSKGLYDVHSSLIPHDNFSGIGRGMIFAIFSYIGFEEVSTVAFRSKNPKKFIPRVLTWTVIIISAIYVIISMIEFIGFKGNITLFAKSSSPLNYLSVEYMNPTMSTIIDLTIFLSFMSSILGCANAASYMIYALGKKNYLPSKFGIFNYKLNAPVKSLNLVIIVSMIIYLLFSIPYGFEQVYNDGVVLGVIGALIVYMMVCAGTIVFFLKKKDVKTSIIRHLLIPVFGIVVLIYPLLSNVYPVPIFPVNLCPYIMIIWVLIGLSILKLKK